ncbi:hypothetical protein V5P93_006226 [Actinokineospora auranticolor]|uniref:Uncharacterized protein YegL n=1 Tax=Actinokineospora auranticolor TaxID=155976 RepID=A0A2S6GI08_9PSEU|nr:hypothetical protein [Actinokineospora auranticolor]PPK64823.1 uncharacterized protein YegL [Actinokineospora auranticolor]
MRPDISPCYVVCDMSSSVVDHIDELNAGLREFRGAVHADRSAIDRVRVGVVGFAGAPRLLHPLRPVVELPEVTAPRPRVGSNFGLAFTFLRGVIDRDVRELTAERLVVRRPVMFFVSDGRPTDPVTWPAAHAALTDPRWPAHPTAVAFGVGAADQGTLARIGTAQVFLGRDGVRVGTALTVSMAWSAPAADPVQGH